MANAPIDYERDVLPLEQQGKTDQEIADILNTMTRRDIDILDYRRVVEDRDVMRWNNATTNRSRGSLGEAPAAPGWDEREQNWLDKFENNLYGSRPMAYTFSKPNNAKLQSDAFIVFRSFNYDRTTYDENGNPSVNNVPAMTDEDITAIVDLGGGWLYGPINDPNKATGAEVTQSRVDYNNQQEKNTAYTFLQDTETQNALNAANAAVSDPAKSKADVYDDFDAQQAIDKANRV